MHSVTDRHNIISTFLTPTNELIQKSIQAHQSKAKNALSLLINECKSCESHIKRKYLFGFVIDRFWIVERLSKCFPHVEWATFDSSLHICAWSIGIAHSKQSTAFFFQTKHTQTKRLLRYYIQIIESIPSCFFFICCDDNEVVYDNGYCEISQIKS